MAQNIGKSRQTKAKKGDGVLPKSYLFLLNRPVFVPLLRLPPELRNRIYQYALRLNEDGVIRVNEGDDFPEPALLSTCTQIRREARGIFYSENAIDGVIRSYSPSIPVFLAKKSIELTRTCGLQLKDLRFIFQGPPRWKNLLSWLRAVHETPAFYMSYTRLAETSSPQTMNPNQLAQYKRQALESGLFGMVILMKGQPWEAIEPALTPYRYGLERFDPQWGVD